MLYDSAFIQYLIGAGINLYGIILFIWWWAKKKGASFVYKCVTFIFVADFIERAISLYGRHLRLEAGGPTGFADSFVYAYKGSIGTAVALTIVSFMTLRALGWVDNGHTRKEDGVSGMCRGLGGQIVHAMNGEVVYYACSRCGQEWKKGQAGYEEAKAASHKEG